MTKPIYTLIDENGMSCVHRVDEDGKNYWIPIDPTNSDYQAYLESLDAPKS
jgi:hypothetical protein